MALTTIEVVIEGEMGEDFAYALAEDIKGGMERLGDRAFWSGARESDPSRRGSVLATPGCPLVAASTTFESIAGDLRRARQFTDAQFGCHQ